MRPDAPENKQDRDGMRRYVLAAAAVVLLLGAAHAAHAATALHTAFAEYQPVGPKAAKGVVIYSHGRSLKSEDMDSPPPAYLAVLAQSGWDALRFDRPTREDSLPASSADLARRVQQLRKKGYKQVVLAGQSFGAFLSVMAAAQTTGVDAVIATSPAAFGSFYDSYDTWQLNATELYKHLDRLNGTRVLLAFFHRDEYDPGGRGPRSEAILAAHHLPHLVIDQPRSLAGHVAGATDIFARRFGACFVQFLDGAGPNARGCDAINASDQQTAAIVGAGS
jgi:pimeloyl-ACP methyl ester carboxylesterase